MLEKVIMDFVYLIVNKSQGDPTRVVQALGEWEGTKAQKDFIVASSLCSINVDGSKINLEKEFHPRINFINLLSDSSFELEAAVLDDLLSNEKIRKEVAAGGEIHYNLFDTISVLKDAFEHSEGKMKAN